MRERERGTHVRVLSVVLQTKVSRFHMLSPEPHLRYISLSDLATVYGPGFRTRLALPIWGFMAPRKSLASSSIWRRSQNSFLLCMLGACLCFLRLAFCS